MLLFYILFVSILTMALIVMSLFYKAIPENKYHNFKQNIFQKGRPLIILFGGTSKIAEKLLQYCCEKKYNIICASRTYEKWYKMLERNKIIKDYPVVWTSCDIRLHRNIEKVFKMAKKWSNNSTIDIAINMAMIHSNNDLLTCPLQTQKNKDDLVLRIPGAYNHEYEHLGQLYKKNGIGNEHGFFTNVIGALNVIRLGKEYDVKHIFVSSEKNNLVKPEWFGIKCDFIEWVDLNNAKNVIDHVENIMII